MKLSLILATVSIAGLSSGCLAEKPSAVQSYETTSKASDARSLLKRIETEFVRGRNPDALDSILATDYVLETSGQSLDREQFKAFASANLAAFPDLDVDFRIVEAEGNHAVAIELVNGTHNGEGPFLGFPTSGAEISFTVLHVIDVVDGRIKHHWAQPDFGGAMAQLQGQATRKTLAEMRADLDAADAVVADDCNGLIDDDATWSKFQGVMQRLDASDQTLDGILSQNFRLSSGGGLNQGREGVKATFAMAGAIGKDQNNSGLAIKYSGPKFVGVAGPVTFTYSNPDGKMGFPAAVDKPVAMNEVQIIGFCGSKVFRQYSHADVLGLLGQIATPVGQ